MATALQEFITDSKQYFENIPSDGTFGGFFPSERLANLYMWTRGYRPIGKPFEPCILINRKSMGYPVPSFEIRARRYAPATPKITPPDKHISLAFRK